MTTLFRTGSLFTYKGRQYCVLSSKPIGRGLHVTAVCVSDSWDDGYWYGFYFTPELLSEVQTQGTVPNGRQGEEERRS